MDLEALLAEQNLDIQKVADEMKLECLAVKDAPPPPPPLAAMPIVIAGVPGILNCTE